MHVAVFPPRLSGRLQWVRGIYWLIIKKFVLNSQSIRAQLLHVVRIIVTPLYCVIIISRKNHDLLLCCYRYYLHYISYFGHI